MAVKPVYGRFWAPGSLAQLTRGRGWNSELVGFLLPLATRNYFYAAYEFETTKTMDTDLTAANSGGTAAVSYAILSTQIEGGAIQGKTGTTDNGTTQVKYNGVVFDAARNPGLEVASKFDVVTGFGYEIAFCDPPTTEATFNTSALTAAGVPTFAANGVTDFMGVTLDTDDTLTTAALITVGTTDAATGKLLGTHTPTAATYFVVRLQVGANKGYAVIDDNRGQENFLASGPDTGVLLRPHIIAVTRNTTTKIHDVDYIRIWAERNY